MRKSVLLLAGLLLLSAGFYMGWSVHGNSLARVRIDATNKGVVASEVVADSTSSDDDQVEADAATETTAETTVETTAETHNQASETTTEPAASDGANDAETPTATDAAAPENSESDDGNATDASSESAEGTSSNN